MQPAAIYHQTILSPKDESREESARGAKQIPVLSDKLHDRLRGRLRCIAGAESQSDEIQRLIRYAGKLNPSPAEYSWQLTLASLQEALHDQLKDAPAVVELLPQEAAAVMAQQLLEPTRESFEANMTEINKRAREVLKNGSQDRQAPPDPAALKLAVQSETVLRKMTSVKAVDIAQLALDQMDKGPLPDELRSSETVAKSALCSDMMQKIRLKSGSEDAPVLADHVKGMVRVAASFKHLVQHSPSSASDRYFHPVGTGTLLRVTPVSDSELHASLANILDAIVEGESDPRLFGWEVTIKDYPEHNEKLLKKKAFSGLNPCVARRCTLKTPAMELSSLRENGHALACRFVVKAYIPECRWEKVIIQLRQESLGGADHKTRKCDSVSTFALPRKDFKAALPAALRKSMKRKVEA